MSDGWTDLEKFPKPDRYPDIKVEDIEIWIDEKLMSCHDSRHAHEQLYIDGFRLDLDETIEIDGVKYYKGKWVEYQGVEDEDGVVRGTQDRSKFYSYEYVYP